jgi:hypothetical protein
MSEPTPEGMGKVKSVLIAIAILAVFGFFIAAIASKPPPPADPMAKEIAAARVAPGGTLTGGLQKTVTGVESVRLAGDALMVFVTIKAAWNEQQLIDFAGIKVENIGEAIQAGEEPLSDGAKWVDVSFEVPLTDRLGNESMGQLMTVTFSADDIRAAKFQNLPVERTLNLATEVRASAVGRSAIAAWCGEAAHADAAQFCSKL